MKEQIEGWKQNVDSKPYHVADEAAIENARLHFNPEHSKDEFTACVISYKKGFEDAVLRLTNRI